MARAITPVRRRFTLYRLEPRPKPDRQCRRGGVEYNSLQAYRLQGRGFSHSRRPKPGNRSETAERRKCLQRRPGFRRARNGSERVLRIPCSHPFGRRRLTGRAHPRPKKSKTSGTRLRGRPPPSPGSASDLPALWLRQDPRSRLGTPATADYRQRSPAALYASSHRREPGRFGRESVLVCQHLSASHPRRIRHTGAHSR